MKILVFILLFFLIGAFFIISENELALKYPENRDKFYDMFQAWANRIFENSKGLIGYVIKLDWLPEPE